MTSQTLKGGPELLQFIEAFPAKLQKGAVRAGLTAAAKPIRDQARANIRKKSGATAKASKSARLRAVLNWVTRRMGCAPSDGHTDAIVFAKGATSMGRVAAGQFRPRRRNLDFPAALAMAPDR